MSKTCQGPGSPGVFKGIFLSGSVQVLRASRFQERGPRGEVPGSLHIWRREPGKSQGRRRK